MAQHNLSDLHLIKLCPAIAVLLGAEKAWNRCCELLHGKGKPMLMQNSRFLLWY